MTRRLSGWDPPICRKSSIWSSGPNPARFAGGRSNSAPTWAFGVVAPWWPWPASGCTRQGWTEISAVCTDPAHRGQGLATRLVSAVAAGIADRGDRVLLHALATNTPAIELYLSRGFRLRRYTEFQSVTTPG